MFFYIFFSLFLLFFFSLKKTRHHFWTAFYLNILNILNILLSVHFERLCGLPYAIFVLWPWPEEHGMILATPLAHKFLYLTYMNGHQQLWFTDWSCFNSLQLSWQSATFLTVCNGLNRPWLVTHLLMLIYQLLKAKPLKYLLVLLAWYKSLLLIWNVEILLTLSN